MRFEKKYAVTLAVANPIDFAAGKAAHLLKRLKEQYEGRCFLGAFIAEVLRVARTSDVAIASSNNSGAGAVDVEFFAAVDVIAKWEPIPGVLVTKRDEVIVGSARGAGGARVVVSLLPRNADTVRVGQRVAVRAVDVYHTPMAEHVSVVGILHTCDRAAPEWRARGALEPAAAAELAPLLAAVRAELAARAAALEDPARRERVWLFESLLYTYRLAGDPAGEEAVPTAGSPPWRGPARPAALRSEREVNVVELAARALELGEPARVDGIWTRPLGVRRSAPLAEQRPAAPRAGAPPPLEVEPRTLVAMLLTLVYQGLVLVREMAEGYPDRAAIEEHSNIWLVMRREQLPAPAE